MAGTSTNRRDIPDPASEEKENSTDDFEKFIEDDAYNFIMGAPLSRLKEAPLRRSMDVSNVTDTVREIYSNCEELDHSHYRPLYHAALKGDWQAAKWFLEANPRATKARVSVFGRTALHVAAMEGHGEFVEKWLEEMPAEAVALPDAFGETALHHAARSANMKSVKALVMAYPALTQSMDRKGWTPLLHAVGGRSHRRTMPSSQRSEYKEVIWFLSLVTTDEEPACPFTGPQAVNLGFLLTIEGNYDISLYLHKRYPNLLLAARGGITALRAFALRPAHFHSGCKFGYWESLIYSFVPVQLNDAPPRKIIRDIENIQNNHVDLVEEASAVGLVSQVFYRMKSFAWKAIEYLGKWHCMFMSVCRHTTSCEGQNFAVFYRMKSFAWKAIEYLVPSVKNVREAKLRHQQAVELLTHIFTQISHEKMNKLMPVRKVADVIGIAVASDVVEIISVCAHFIPDVIWFSTSNGYIMEIAIKQRREKIFAVMNDMAARNEMMADLVYLTGRGNLLHVAAKLAPTHQLTSTSGAAFQMQRELLWFSEVKKLIPTAYRFHRNEDGKIPWEVFVEEHKELLDKGEKWMKDTSNYLMVVTTLIASVVFAAAVNVPGGRNGVSGIPIFLWDKSFMVFAIADALALFCSVTALLVFLSILTARFAPEDFLETLPKRLIKGLASLFFAIVAVMIAFGATLSIMLAERWKWIYIPVTLLASFPAIMYVKLQLPLFIQMVQSTYGSGTFRPQKLW